MRISFRSTADTDSNGDGRVAESLSTKTIEIRWKLWKLQEFQFMDTRVPVGHLRVFFCRAHNG